MNSGATLKVKAELENLVVIRRFVKERAQALLTKPTAIDDIVLAVDEAATNVMVHGYQSEAGQIEIEIQPEESSLIIRLRDQAPVFDPTYVPEPDLTLPFDQRPLGGLGVFLIRHFMDQVIYHPTPGGGNELTLIKEGVLSKRPKDEN